MTPLPRASARRHLSLLVAASLVAGAGLVGLAAPVEPAAAAPVDATAGSLSWGIDADYRATFANYRTATAPASFVDDVATFPLSGGTWDDASQQGELAFSGTARIGYVLGSDAQVGTAQGNYVHLGSPTVSISGGVATISGTTAGSSHDLNPALPTQAKATRSFATVDLSDVQAVSTPTSITWTAAPAAITAQGARVLALLEGSDASQTPQVRTTGSSLDPVTITVDRTLAAEPEPEPEPEAEPDVETEPSVPAVPSGSGEGRRIVFDQSDQRVWLVGDDDEVVRTYLVSGSLTDNLDPGTYEVYSRSQNAWGVDDSGTMQYFVRFTEGDAGGAIGFHDIPVDNGSRVQSIAQLGTPQSHGCIRQKREDAIALWGFAPIGTEVDVTA